MTRKLWNIGLCEFAMILFFVFRSLRTIEKIVIDLCVCPGRAARSSKKSWLPCGSKAAALKPVNQRSIMKKSILIACVLMFFGGSASVMATTCPKNMPCFDGPLKVKQQSIIVPPRPCSPTLRKLGLCNK